MTKKLYLPFLMAMVVALMTSCSKKMMHLQNHPVMPNESYD